ncbi:MAG: type IV pilus assembly protein PilM [Candidatus Adiutrix sp.]|jgi:type IV pilus assembly protein PilM|nr:type IV pilus assembly protein PilM [Candidatus Adiutrix sp.]
MAINVLGIDIGSYAAKIITLGSIKGNRATLTGMGMAQVPTDLVLNWEDEPAPAKTAISQAMKNLVAKNKISGKYVSTSVSGDSIVVKKITMPIMSPAELKTAVIGEAEQYIPFSISEINLSYHVLDTSRDEGQMTVLLVAARKKVVQNYMEAMAVAKLKPAVIDVDGLALCNAYEFTYPGHTDDVVLVDIGANMINTIVMNRGIPMVIKDEQGGGRYLTYELATVLDTDLEQAEAIKFGSEAAPNPGEAAEVVDRISANWIAAVERVMDSARAENALYRPKKILLSGGSSLLPGLTSEFQKYFGLETTLFNPLLNLTYNAKKFDPDYLRYIGPQMAVSFGLALRKVEVQ